MFDPMSLLGAGTSLIGGLLGSSSQQKQREQNKLMFNAQIAANDRINAQNVALQREINAANVGSAERINAANIAQAQWLNAQNIAEAQRAEAAGFARDDTKVRRLMADAQAAGIHPLAALGSSITSTSASPVSPGFSGADLSWAEQHAPRLEQANVQPPYGDVGGNPLGDAIANAGLILSQARSAQLDNRLKEAQIRNVDANTANVLLGATSRTVLQRMRAAAIGGPVGGSTNLGSSGRSVRIAGGTLADSGSFSPANDIENEYGDIIGMILGGVKFGVDVLSQEGKKWYRDAKRAQVASDNSYSKKVYDWATQRTPPVWEWGRYFPDDLGPGPGAP